MVLLTSSQVPAMTDGNTHKCLPIIIFVVDNASDRPNLLCIVWE